MKQLILASGSPRRKKLLQKTGLTFVVDVSNIPEPMDMSKDPQTLAKDLSRLKAQEVAKRHKQAIVLAADTFVVMGNLYLGKPKDRKDAERMLVLQSGKMQEIVSGFTIIDTDTNEIISGVDTARLFMKKLTKKQINEYLDKNTFLDKAGAYAIQEVGDIFVEKIEGDEQTIIGLPVKKVMEELRKLED